MNAYFSYEADWLKQRNAGTPPQRFGSSRICGRRCTGNCRINRRSGSRSRAAVGQSSAANRAVRRRQLGVRRPRPAPRLRERTGRDVAAYGTTDIVANPRQYLAPERPTLLVSSPARATARKAWRRWSWPTSCCRKATT